MNMQGAYDSNKCQECLKEEETQKHIYQCDNILKSPKFQMGFKSEK